MKQVVTKRGETIDITTNETEDIDWSLLEKTMPKPGDYAEFPPDKLKLAMDKELSSLRDFDVFEETTIHKLGNR